MRELNDDRLAELEQGLIEVLPGLQLVDSDLSLGGIVVADLVGVDGTGRLTLVRFCKDDGVELVLNVLDTLARVQAGLGRLAVHLDVPNLRTDLEAQLILVADQFTPQTTRRLSPLFSGPLTMYERNELESSKTKAVYLVPVESQQREVQVKKTSDVESFIEALPRVSRDGAKGIIARLRRIDRDLVCRRVGDGLQWQFGSELVCVVRSSADGLEGQVDSVAELMSLDMPGEVDQFLEQALGRYLELAHGAPPEPALEEVVVVPHNPNMILSPDEIEAFRH